jgi:hypothetical protein
MAAELYVKEPHESALNAVQAAEIVQEGDIVHLLAGGEVKPANVSGSDTADAIVPHRERGPQIREDDEDYSAVQYEQNEGPVPIYMFHDGLKLTEQALVAAEAVQMFEEVALDANRDVVPSGSGAAETGALGIALRDAEVDEGVHVRLEK